MNTIEEHVHQIDGGAVLDVATGAGGFVRVLADGLRSFGTITGIDTSERAASAFCSAFAEAPWARFVSMDAAHMTFDDASFDTVAISSSLHHMPDAGRVLDEMLRVVRPGGHLIVAEMYRDGQTDAQMTHVLLHDWWAAIDARLGTFHRPTFTRAALISLLEPLHLVDVIVDDVADLSSDPLEPEGVTEIDGVIDRYMSQAASLPDAPELRRTGEDLRLRLHTVGAHGATQLLVTGRKPVLKPEHTRDTP